MNQETGSSSFDFETLELYKKSLDYIDFVYNFTNSFPREELFGLSDQMKRAANSIALNIGEEYGESVLLGLKYMRIVRGSIRECIVCSTVGFRRNWINQENYTVSREKLTELSKLAAGYVKYLKSKLK